MLINKIGYTILITVFASTLSHAQNFDGISFEKDQSWLEILQKAKEVNKLIFIDAYTTWCLPCKFMTEKIFSQAKVGDFFNKNFINVAIQMDRTKTDNAEIIRWHEDAKTVAENYKIEAYPTYLFLNQSGDVIHILTGATESADDFIAKAKKALDPKTQYSYLKQEFLNGKRDSAFLSSLINTAIEANDDSSLHTFINSYLANQSDLLTPRNISLISKGTSKSTDKGFNILINNSKEIEAIIDNEKRIEILNKIAFDEEIFPVIMIGGKKTEYGGGLTVYGGGEMNKNVNWAIIKANLEAKYQDLVDYILLNGKLKYFIWMKDWESFNGLLSEYISKTINIDTGLVNYFAGKLLNECEEKNSFKDAIHWASTLAKSNKHPYYLETYSRLLYKAGEKEKAILYFEKYASLLKNPDKSVNETIEKMKNGKEID